MSRGHGLRTMTKRNLKLTSFFLTALGHECKTALSIDHNLIIVMKVSEVSSNGNLEPTPFIQHSSITTCLSQVSPAKTKRAPIRKPTSLTLLARGLDPQPFLSGSIASHHRNSCLYARVNPCIGSQFFLCFQRAKSCVGRLSVAVLEAGSLR